MMSVSPSLEILDGLAAEQRVKNLLSASSRVRLAVAYWGRGAMARLGLETLQGRQADIEITCDLMSGACNPDEICELIKLFGAKRVRTKDGLHAKVWITDVGCLLGSSNASANGLGHEGDETLGLIEANLAFPGEPKSMLVAWEKWYETSVRAGSVPIGPEMLKKARERWAARRSLRDGPSASSWSHGSLLAALRNNPGRFRDKPFKVIIHEHIDLSDEATQGWEAAQAEYEEIGVSRLTAYESWRVPAGTYILDFGWDPTRQTARYDGLWKIMSEHPYRRLQGTSITLCTRAPSFEGLSPANETAALAQAATEVMVAHRWNAMIVAAEEFGRLLNEGEPIRS